MAKRITGSTPKLDGYRMPAEFEPQAGVWMLWPERNDNWRDGAKPAQKAFLDVATAILQFEPVTVCVSPAQYQNARERLPRAVRVVEMASNDAWIRDCGPTFLVNDNGGVRAVDWMFNAWGGLVDGLYFPWDLDDQVAQKVCEIERVDSYRTEGFVLEGGSIHVDGEGTVQEQLLKIHADRYTPNDAGCLPTGELAPVAGTAMDFRSFKAIGKDADSDEPCVKPFRGYDVNFCLDGSVPAIEAKSLKSGIVMHVTTDQPGVQLFTANHMKERIGKNGQQYGHRSAFCLETQHFPDCIHHPDWPSCVLRAGEVFDSKTIYSFTRE